MKLACVKYNTVISNNFIIMITKVLFSLHLHFQHSAGCFIQSNKYCNNKNKLQFSTKTISRMIN